MDSFPLKAWNAAACDMELRRVLLPRTIQKMVFYRLQDGSPAALQDACWHRLLPRSLGRLDGDELVCGHHGLVFNDPGRCTHRPSQATLNPSACVRSCPVVDKYRFVWVWPGDAALAGPALIPGPPWHHVAQWLGGGKRLPVRRLRHALREGAAGSVREGETSLESPQRAIAEHPEQPEQPEHPLDQRYIDAGSKWARKLINKQLAAEGASPGQRTSAWWPAA